MSSSPLESNAYQPVAPPQITGYQASQERIAEISAQLNVIAFWQRFFGILAVIFCLILFCVIGVQLVVLVNPSGNGGGFMGIGLMAMLFGTTILFYGLPAMRLFEAASQAKKYARGESADLAEVLNTQQAFWRIVGILATVVLCIYGITLILSVFLGFAAATMR